MNTYSREFKDYLEDEINKIVNDPLNSKLLANKLAGKSRSFIESKLKLIDDWGNRLIYKIETADKELLRNRFIVSDALIFYTTPDIYNGNLYKRTGKSFGQCLHDEQDRFRAVVQYSEKGLYIHIAEVAEQYRGTGLMNKMIESITSFAFDYYGCSFAFGRADDPFFSIYTQKPNKNDWRLTKDTVTGNTNLLNAWINKGDGFKVAGWDGLEKQNAFVIPNPEYKPDKQKSLLLKHGFIID